MLEKTSVETFLSSKFFGIFPKKLKECHRCIKLKGCDQGMRSGEVITDLKPDGIENGKFITQLQLPEPPKVEFEASCSQLQNQE